MRMERYNPDSYPDWVIKDELTPVHVEEIDADFMIGHKYDHIRYHPQINHYVLKVSTDDKGMVSMHVDGAMAAYIAEETGIEIVEYERMTRTEYDAYIESKTNDIEGWLDG